MVAAHRNAFRRINGLNSGIRTAAIHMKIKDELFTEEVRRGHIAGSKHGFTNCLGVYSILQVVIIVKSAYMDQ